MVDWANVRISLDLAEEVKKFVESKLGRSLRYNSQADFVAQAVREALERVRERRPRFNHVNMYEDHVKILDRELERHGRIVSVYFKIDGRPYCEYEKNECVHVDYAWEIPEVARVLDPKGIRKSRRKGDAA